MVTSRGPRKRRTSPKASPNIEVIVDDRGEPTAVILPIEDYEDLCDLAAIEARKDEPSIPWEKVKKRLRADGLLSN